MAPPRYLPGRHCHCHGLTVSSASSGSPPKSPFNPHPLCVRCCRSSSQPPPIAGAPPPFVNTAAPPPLRPHPSSCLLGEPTTPSFRRCARGNLLVLPGRTFPPTSHRRAVVAHAPFLRHGPPPRQDRATRPRPSWLVDRSRVAGRHTPWAIAPGRTGPSTVPGLKNIFNCFK
jgi:hypothetical protein